MGEVKHGSFQNTDSPNEIQSVSHSAPRAQKRLGPSTRHDQEMNDTITTVSSYSSLEQTHGGESDDDDNDSLSQHSSPSRATPPRHARSPARLSTPRNRKKIKKNLRHYHHHIRGELGSDSPCTLERVEENEEESSTENLERPQILDDIRRKAKGGAPAPFLLELSDSSDSSACSTATHASMDEEMADDYSQFVQEIEGRSTVASPSIQLEAPVPRHGHPNYKLVCKLQQDSLQNSKLLQTYSRLQPQVKNKNSSAALRQDSESLALLQPRRAKPRSSSPSVHIQSDHTFSKFDERFYGPHQTLKGSHGRLLDKNSFSRIRPPSVAHLEELEFFDEQGNMLPPPSINQTPQDKSRSRLSTSFKSRSISEIVSSPPSEQGFKQSKHRSSQREVRSPSPTPSFASRQKKPTLRLSPASLEALHALKKSPDVAMFTSAINSSSRKTLHEPDLLIATRPPSRSNVDKQHVSHEDEVIMENAQSEIKSIDALPMPAHGIPVSLNTRFMRIRPASWYSRERFIYLIYTETISSSTNTIVQSIESYIPDPLAPLSALTEALQDYDKASISPSHQGVVAAFESPSALALRRLGIRHGSERLQVHSKWKSRGKQGCRSNLLFPSSQKGKLLFGENWEVSRRQSGKSYSMHWQKPFFVSHGLASTQGQSSAEEIPGKVQEELSPFTEMLDETETKESWREMQRENHWETPEINLEKTITQEKAPVSSMIRLMEGCLSVEMVCLLGSPNSFDSVQTSNAAAKIIQRSYRKLKQVQRMKAHDTLKKMAGRQCRREQYYMCEGHKLQRKHAAARIIQGKWGIYYGKCLLRAKEVHIHASARVICRFFRHFHKKLHNSSKTISRLFLRHHVLVNASARIITRFFLSIHRTRLQAAATTICYAIARYHQRRFPAKKLPTIDTRKSHRNHDHMIREDFQTSTTTNDVGENAPKIDALHGNVAFIRQGCHRQIEKVNFRCEEQISGQSLSPSSPQTGQVERGTPRHSSLVVASSQQLDYKQICDKANAFCEEMRRHYTKSIVERTLELRNQKEAALVIFRAMQYNRAIRVMRRRVENRKLREKNPPEQIIYRALFRYRAKCLLKRKIEIHRQAKARLAAKMRFRSYARRQRQSLLKRKIRSQSQKNSIEDS